MQVICDLHIHSKYSRATSKEMNLDGLSKGAKLKGLNLLGTGDFTHPLWLRELKEKLNEIENLGLYKYNDIYFMLTTEVSTVFEYEGKIRKVHHVIHAPSFEIVDQINESLSKYGDLKSDGRPTLNLSAVELVDILMNISKDIVITPAHIWTPWFSLFGSRSGFDRIQDCFQEKTKYIFSLETGLSSDPLMCWRLSSLDRFALLSNSDSHSPHPWRIGREANVFELKEVSYYELFDAVKKKDNKRFLYTIEVSPNYGKYHFDGHRKCNVCFSPKEAEKFNNICPICRKKLTVGVLHRVEELADREEGYIPKDAIQFKTLLPLYEIISYVMGINQLYSKPVLQEHDKLIEKIGSELNVLLNVPYEDLIKITNEKIAKAIIKVRNGEINYIPGYDGVYGKPVFNGKETVLPDKKVSQLSLKDF
jgi:uncharacterized protein (TIGR00375 family)